MTLSNKPTDLACELRASREKLERMREVWNDIVKGYHGRAWDASYRGGAEPTYHTHNYEAISLLLPKLVHQAPRFNFSTTRGGRQAVLVRALERGLNHWSRASRLQEPLEEIARDALMLVGGAFVEEVPSDRMRLSDDERTRLKGSLRRPKSLGSVSPEDAEKPHWPRVKRLEPFRWGWDMAATSEDGIRFWWHKVTEDKNDLLRKAGYEDQGWNKSAINDLATTRDSKDLGYAHDGTPDRNQVTYYVMWVPDARIEGEEPKADEHGVIYTLSCKTEEGDRTTGAMLRDPYYFYGPPQGPYVKAGFYTVPNSTLPLSPLVGTWDLSDIASRVMRSTMRRIEKYRRGAIFDLKDKKDIERIESSKDLDLIGVAGFDGNLAQFEVGGITAQDIEQSQIIRERLQSASGMDDVQRGNVTGAGTATEVAIAAEGSAERVAFLISKWRQVVADIAQRVAWYAAHDDRIIFTYRVEEDQRDEVASEAIEAGAMTPEDAEVFRRYGSATFAGGDFAEDAEKSDELLFGDLDFDVEPYSMQRRDQRTRKMDTVEALNVLSSFGAAAMQGVPIDFGKIADILADVYALPELEEVVNRNLAMQQGILSMQERVAAMEKDTASSGDAEAKPASGGRARSERAAPPASAPRQTQKGLL